MDPKRVLPGRIAKRAVSPDELGPVAAEGPGRVIHIHIHIEEGNPSGELRVVGVPGKERTAVGINFSDYMHCCFRPQVSKNPFRVSCGGETARPAGLVSYLQHRELNRCIYGHINPQLGADAALRVLEDTVAKSVPGYIMHRPAAGKRRGGPEMAALFIAEVECLSARITHRIVVPWCEAELVGILRPCICRAAL